MFDFSPTSTSHLSLSAPAAPVQMNLHTMGTQLSPAMLNVFDSVAIMLLIPCVDRGRNDARDQLSLSSSALLQFSAPKAPLQKLRTLRLRLSSPPPHPTPFAPSSPTFRSPPLRSLPVSCTLQLPSQHAHQEYSKWDRTAALVSGGYPIPYPLSADVSSTADGQRFDPVTPSGHRLWIRHGVRAYRRPHRDYAQSLSAPATRWHLPRRSRIRSSLRVPCRTAPLVDLLKSKLAPGAGQRPL